ncbi:MAG: Two-component system-sensor histidine [Bacteroidetes bacterium]|nr:MAG: Two-component system-sensor histidine [Bacteroidota bacterium]
MKIIFYVFQLHSPLRIFLSVALVTILIFPLKAFAQSGVENRKSDSLKIVRLNELFEIQLKGNQLNSARATNDSIFTIAGRSDMYKSIGSCYFNYALIERALKNTDGFLENLKLSIPWYLKAGANSSASRAHTIIGQTIANDDYAAALENFRASLELRQQTDDTLGITNNLINIGTMQYQMGRYSEANTNFYQALELASQSRNDKLKAYSLNNLSNIHNKLKNYEVSHDYLRQALAIHQKTGNKKSEFHVIMNIGNTFYEQGNKTEAKKYFEQALDFHKSNGLEERSLISIFNNLGLVVKSEGDTVRAIQYFNQALGISKAHSDKQGITIALSNLGQITDKGNEASSLSQLHESLKEAKALGLSKMVLNNYGSLRDFYSKKGDFKKAYEYATKYQMLNDSIYDAENADRIIELQTRYETAEKEKQLVIAKKEKLEKDLELNKANVTKYGMIGISAILLLLLGSLYSRYLIKRRSQMQLAVINEKLNELNNTKDKLFSIVSHDLKNSMSGFSGIVNTLNSSYEKFSADQVKYYVGEVSASANSMKGLLRNLLDWARSQQNLIKVCPSQFSFASLVSECTQLIDQQLRRKNIEVVVAAADDLMLVSDKNIVTTIVRNLLVNAVKYSHEGGRIDITSNLANQEIEISVADNGVGMDQQDVDFIMNSGTFMKSKPGVQGEKGAGLGLMLTKELLEKISGRLVVVSEKGKGSTFSIVIPLLQNIEIHDSEEVYAEEIR